MAWRRGDTEAFNAVMTAGDKVRAMYEKYQAGQAYKEGSALTNPEDFTTQEARRDVAADVAGPRPGQEFDSYDFQRGGLGATAPAQQEYTDAANRASQASTAGTKYYVGAGDTKQAYDTAPTARQIHRGGLGGQAARLASMGDVEGASKLQERIDASEMQDHRRALMPGELEAQKLGLSAQRRLQERDELDLRREATRDNIIKEYGDAIRKAQAGDYSGLQTVAGSDYNNNVPGFDDGKRVRFIDGDAIAVTDEKGNGVTRPLTKETALRMLEEGMSRRLSAISAKDWQHEREFRLTKGVRESEADYKKRMVKVAEDKEVREGKQDAAEWGPGGLRDRYLKAVVGAKSGGDKGIVTDVTWKDESGEVRTGKVGLERDGRKLKMYDIGTGKDIPVADPRYQAMLSGVPKSAKDDPEVNPEIANLNAKIKKGEATPEDLGRLNAIRAKNRVQQQFDAASAQDRNAAVVDLVRRLPSLAETPEAQSLALREFGVTSDEADRARKYIKQGIGIGRGSVYRGVNRANQAAGENDPSGNFQSEYLMRPVVE
jgi:hypothetical protein